MCTIEVKTELILRNYAPGFYPCFLFVVFIEKQIVCDHAVHRIRFNLRIKNNFSFLPQSRCSPLT